MSDQWIDATKEMRAAARLYVGMVGGPCWAEEVIDHLIRMGWAPGTVDHFINRSQAHGLRFNWTGNKVTLDGDDGYAFNGPPAATNTLRQRLRKTANGSSPPR